METISMRKRFVMANAVSILFMLIAVESQSLLPSNDSSSEETSLLSDTKYLLELQPQSTQNDEFPQDPNEPFEIEFPLGTESNDEIPTPPPPSPAPPSPTKPAPCPPKHPWTLDDTCKTRQEERSSLCELLLSQMHQEILGYESHFISWK
ncbi:hypothetical protein V6N12_074572 [Hibiscus sabdariffa]|uniref:Uncharacterized protein n=1 Tax=Hibiscus sabdariffa TaxID=183260 RepID=A0ABR2BZD7_9ROSI